MTAFIFMVSIFVPVMVILSIVWLKVFFTRPVGKTHETSPEGYTKPSSDPVEKPKPKRQEVRQQTLEEQSRPIPVPVEKLGLRRREVGRRMFGPNDANTYARLTGDDEDNLDEDVFSKYLKRHPQRTPEEQARWEANEKAAMWEVMYPNDPIWPKWPPFGGKP
jgi:hypothetical protein